MLKTLKKRSLLNTIKMVTYMSECDKNKLKHSPQKTIANLKKQLSKAD